MRKMKASDIPALCRCLKNIGIKDEIQKIAKEANNAKDAWNKGFDLVWAIFDVATEKKGEKHLYEFLAGIFEVTPKELEDMELAEFLSGLKQIAVENDLVSFFESAEALMK